MGSACVPNVFDQAQLPKPKAEEFDTDGEGTRYLRSTLDVVFRDPAADAAARFAKMGGEVVGSIPFVGFYQVRFASATTAAALDALSAQLEADPAIEFADRERVYDNAAMARPRSTDLESCTMGDGRWAYNKIGLPAAWDAIYQANARTTPVVVAVLDGPVVAEPVFHGLPLRYGADFRVITSFAEDPDDARHGTEVASIIGARNDDKGMNGLLAGLPCLDYDLAPIPVLGEFAPDKKGKQLPAQLGVLMNGLVWAVKSGARVVNLSFGFIPIKDPNDAKQRKRIASLAKLFQRIFSYAPDVLFVVSVGNVPVDAALFIPAAAAIPTADFPELNVIAVGATGPDDQRAVWTAGQWESAKSTTMGSITLAAPGTDVLATLPDGKLKLERGTSVAAPLVSGAAGLIFALRPELKGVAVRRLLVDNADLAGTDVGGKRLNVGRAVTVALAGAESGGQCQEVAKENSCGSPCPGHQACAWCLNDAKITLTDPRSNHSGTYQGKGYLLAQWTDLGVVGSLSLSSYAPKQNVEASFGFDTYNNGNANPGKVQFDYSRNSIQVTKDYSQSGEFWAGPSSIFDFQNPPWIWIIADHSEFSAKFDQANVTGSFSGNHVDMSTKPPTQTSGVATFSGTFHPVEPDDIYLAGFVHCHF